MPPSTKRRAKKNFMNRIVARILNRRKKQCPMKNKRYSSKRSHEKTVDLDDDYDDVEAPGEASSVEHDYEDVDILNIGYRSQQVKEDACYVNLSTADVFPLPSDNVLNLGNHRNKRRQRARRKIYSNNQTDLAECFESVSIIPRQTVMDDDYDDVGVPLYSLPARKYVSRAKEEHPYDDVGLPIKRSDIDEEKDSVSNEDAIYDDVDVPCSEVWKQIYAPKR